VVASVAGVLVSAALLGAVGVALAQRDIKKDVASNHEMAGVCCEKAEKNQNDITVIATEWRIFQIQYAVDQDRAAGERAAILEAVK
jgi:predicted Zn-dependent protease